MLFLRPIKKAQQFGAGVTEISLRPVVFPRPNRPQTFKIRYPRLGKIK